MTPFKPYELLPHTADIKMRAYGRSLPELFVNAVAGMFAVCGPRAAHPRIQTHRMIRTTSTTHTYLLIDFLSDCLCAADTYHEAYDRVDVQELTDTAITAVLTGYTIESFENTEIKAVTYHGATVEHTNGLWSATVLFDI